MIDGEIEVEAWACPGACSHEYCGLGVEYLPAEMWPYEAWDYARKVIECGATTVLATLDDGSAYEVRARGGEASGWIKVGGLTEGVGA